MLTRAKPARVAAPPRFAGRFCARNPRWVQIHKHPAHHPHTLRRALRCAYRQRALRAQTVSGWRHDSHALRAPDACPSPMNWQACLILRPVVMRCSLGASVHHVRFQRVGSAKHDSDILRVARHAARLLRCVQTTPASSRVNCRERRVKPKRGWPGAGEAQAPSFGAVDRAAAQPFEKRISRG